MASRGRRVNTAAKGRRVKPGEIPIPKLENGENTIAYPDQKKKCGMQMPPQYGNGMAYIDYIFTSNICACGEEHTTRLYVFKNKYMAFECTNTGFIWMEKPKDINDLIAGL